MGSVFQQLENIFALLRESLNDFLIHMDSGCVLPGIKAHSYKMKKKIIAHPLC